MTGGDRFTGYPSILTGTQQSCGYNTTNKFIWTFGTFIKNCRRLRIWLESGCKRPMFPLTSARLWELFILAQYLITLTVETLEKNVTVPNWRVETPGELWNLNSKKIYNKTSFHLLLSHNKSNINVLKSLYKMRSDAMVFSSARDAVFFLFQVYKSKTIPRCINMKVQILKCWRKNGWKKNQSKKTKPNQIKKTKNLYKKNISLWIDDDDDEDDDSKDTQKMYRITIWMDYIRTRNAPVSLISHSDSYGCGYTHIFFAFQLNVKWHKKKTKKSKKKKFA